MIVGQVELDDHFEFIIRYGRDRVGCPISGSTIARKHECTFQRKKDRKLRDKIVVLSLETDVFAAFAVAKCLLSRTISLVQRGVGLSV